jgi:alkyl hydroperoxide reductase subunit AhpF
MRHALGRGWRRDSASDDSDLPSPRVGTGGIVGEDGTVVREVITSKLYDVVIVGAGHNGLTAAAYLARSGRSVCVVERRSVLGGACVTE